MTASPRVQMLTDNLAGMQLLAQFLANPRLVDDLKQEVVSLNKLTEAESAQLEEAKAAIRDRDKVLEETTNLRASLDTMQAEYEQKLAAEKQDFEQYKSDITTKLQADRADVDRQLAFVADQTKLLDQRDNELKEKAEAVAKIIEG